MDKKKITILVIGVIIIILVCFGIYKTFTKDTNNNNDIDSDNNIKNENNNTDLESGELTSGDEMLTTSLWTEETYPKVDGSTATIPLSKAFKANFLGKELDEVEVNHSTTHPAYEKLINDEVDLILVTYPSEEEMQLAKDNGVELEIIPVVNEAFVFFTNAQNPVKNLTLEQIQKIYTGEITNWKQVGGDDLSIKPYQREPNSGSQSGMLKLVMNGLELMEPLTEYIIDTMMEIVRAVSSYDNGIDAIGYSYYYYATTMYDVIDREVANGIRLLGVNGIEPSNETIKNGTYPIRTNYYIVINKAEPEDSEVRKLVSAMLSERGQSVAENAGYVGM